MNRHPSDEEILDALAPGAEPDAALREHLATCPECRARIEAERPLRDRLATLPDAIDPPRDLWPAVRGRIEAEPRRAGGAAVHALEPARARRWTSPALRTAAAVALFVAGAVAGRALAPGGPAVEPESLDDPLGAAAEVQRAGTAYVEALARFRATAGEASGPVADQARDVAIAAVHGAAWELERLRPEDLTARGIVALAGEGRLAEGAP